MNGIARWMILVEFKMMQSHGNGWTISSSPLSSKTLYDRKSMNPSKTQQLVVLRAFSTLTTVGAFTPWQPLKKRLRISIPPRIFMKATP